MELISNYFQVARVSLLAFVWVIKILKTVHDLIRNGELDAPNTKIAISPVQKLQTNSFKHILIIFFSTQELM